MTRFLARLRTLIGDAAFVAIAALCVLGAVFVIAVPILLIVRAVLGVAS